MTVRTAALRWASAVSSPASGKRESRSKAVRSAGRKHHVDPEIGAPLGDERLGTEEGIDRDLDPAPVPEQRLLEAGVVDVVAGIALVAGEVHRAIHRDREVEVDLNQAVEVALVPVVGVPGSPLHVLQVESLAVGQRHVGPGAGPAGRDRGAEDGVHPAGGNDHPVAEALEAPSQWSAARQQRIEPGQQRVEVGVGEVRRRHVVQRLRLLIEAEPLAVPASGPARPSSRAGCGDSGAAGGPSNRRRPARCHPAPAPGNRRRPGSRRPRATRPVPRCGASRGRSTRRRSWGRGPRARARERRSAGRWDRERRDRRGGSSDRQAATSRAAATGEDGRSSDKGTLTFFRLVRQLPVFRVFVLSCFRVCFSEQPTG